MHPSPARRPLRIGLGVLAGLALLAGIAVTLGHLDRDPLADVHAYYDAGRRLNEGLPLYAQAATTDEAEYYRYPPLLAIAFRPLALLPFPVAAAIWEGVLVVLFVLTLRRIWRGPATLVVLGLLAPAIGWALAIGQAQVAVTFLTALASPWAIALAANLKLFPALVACWWLGRRDWRRLAQFAAACGALVLVQLVLEPGGTLAFPGVLGFEQVGQVRNLSPYEVSPLLWGVLVVAGVGAAVVLAPTRYGWIASVALSVLATPRLLFYHLMTLAAGLARPAPEDPERDPVAPASRLSPAESS